MYILMKQSIYLFLGIWFLLSSCASKKIQPSFSETPIIENNLEKEVPEVNITFREVEERLIPNSNSPVNNNNYFVVIGSFRNLANAEKYQKQLLTNGFNSEILLSESGLNRVSVLSTDDIKSAREEVIRIRKYYPEYYDVWLLIRKL